MLLISS